MGDPNLGSVYEGSILLGSIRAPDFWKLSYGLDFAWGPRILGIYLESQVAQNNRPPYPEPALK